MRPEALVLAGRLGLRHHLIDDPHHLRCVAVRVVATEQIALKLDDECLRGPEHLRLGPAEPIDALLGVADDEQAGSGTARPRIAAQPGIQRLPLQRVGVLEFVDQQVLHARIEPLLQPARKHGIGEHRLGCSLDVVHVHPTALALERGEFPDQQAGQARHALVVQPGLMLGAGRREAKGQILRGTNLRQALEFLAELARLSLLREQGLQDCIHVARGQCALQLHTLGRESRRTGPSERTRGIGQLLPRLLQHQQIAGLAQAAELRKLLAEGFDRGFYNPVLIGQRKLHPLGQRGQQGLLGLKAAMRGHRGFEVRARPGLRSHGRMERRQTSAMASLSSSSNS